MQRGQHKPFRLLGYSLGGRATDKTEQVERLPQVVLAHPFRQQLVAVPVQVREHRHHVDGHSWQLAVTTPNDSPQSLRLTRGGRLKYSRRITELSETPVSFTDRHLQAGDQLARFLGFIRASAVWKGGQRQARADAFPPGVFINTAQATETAPAKVIFGAYRWPYLVPRWAGRTAAQMRASVACQSSSLPAEQAPPTTSVRPAHPEPLP